MADRACKLPPALFHYTPARPCNDGAVAVLWLLLVVFACKVGARGQFYMPAWACKVGARGQFYTPAWACKVGARGQFYMPGAAFLLLPLFLL